MTPELKSKWLTALRSGKYQQGEGALNSNGKMCCLGVLCDVAGYKWRPFNGGYGHKECDAGTYFFKNIAEMEKLQLPKHIHDTCYSMNDGTFTPQELNDFNLEDRKYSFKEIADFVEKNL